MEHSQASLAAFQKLLDGRGLKLTYERKGILDEIFRLRGHFDADSLYAYLKGKGLRTSRDTVYRTIPLLLESGVIQKSAGRGKRSSSPVSRPPARPATPGTSALTVARTTSCGISRAAAAR
jgi:Fe2+ or Zn2+ uptake regulation protein